MISTSAPLCPNQTTIGVFGSGQLGRMLAIAARRMGYRVATFSPDKNSPTGQIADQEIVASYSDASAVRTFVQSVDVVTFEFENVPISVAEIADEVGIPVRPSGQILKTAQNRLREKTFLAEAGLPVTPFVYVTSLSQLHSALTTLGTPAILKSADFGYDGKGQVRIDSIADAERAWESLAAPDAVLEAFIDFTCEVSVVAARDMMGNFAYYGLIENQHRNHILDLSIAPARVDHTISLEAEKFTRSLFESLDVIGVLCVEFFVQSDGQLLINEIAPRPHNSGHLTVDAAITDQFEQQLRAVCGLPLGSTELTRPAVMANLLGDLWENGEPNWAALCAFPTCKLHLYGKEEARPGRKMGHITVLADTIEEARKVAIEARQSLAVS